MSMSILIAFLLAGAAGQDGPPPRVDSAELAKKPIEQVELAPPYDRPFACSEHPEGQLDSVGDALGTDCMVIGGLIDGKGFSRTYVGDGSRNEDWYGWKAELHAPFDGVVQRIHINPVSNAPGRLGRPPASIVVFKRDDGVEVVFAHVDDVRVKVGERVSTGQIFAVVGNNGMARNPHTHVGAYRGRTPLQIRWDLRAEGHVPGIVGG